jgi:hypothetical protein
MKNIITICLLALLVGCQVQSGPSIPVKKQTESPGWQATKYMLGAYSAPSKLVEERTISDDEIAFRFEIQTIETNRCVYRTVIVNTVTGKAREE